MATKQKKTKYTPKLYHVEVNVDSKGNFQYTANGVDAKTIRPRNTDKVSWSVKLGGIPVPFQVEFPGYGPFGIGNRVARSLFGATDPLTVSVPNYYHGNLVLKYTVTLPNGWSDDPDVVPVLSDGLDPLSLDTNVVLLSVDLQGNLVLNPPDASYAKGEVAWKWAGDPQDDFTLKFAAPVPAGWPPVTQSQSYRIALDLETPATAEKYTIETPNLGLSASGTLTIS